MTTSSRQLAAIMFTDIVGYTAMMQQNEQKAVVVIKRYNASLEKYVTQFGGRVVNYYGDGSLCIFSSATDSVDCSVALQRELKTPPVVPLRIGLHIGEVFFENEKALGDGVNVASRVQSLGKENSVLISEEVYDKIKNNSAFSAVSLGRFDFKNVGKPVHVFALTNAGLSVPHRKQLQGKVKEKDSMIRNAIPILSLILLIFAVLFAYKKMFQDAPNNEMENSIAVLPFVNMSADTTQEYFSDGMTESIITDLGRIPGLFVIARNSVIQYKGKTIDPIEVGHHLNVRYLLQGSVQHSGDMLRITAQLVETRKGVQVWGEKFDRKLQEVFVIQDDISHHIINSLKLVIAEREDRIPKPPTENLEAYDYYLRGHYLWSKWRGRDRMMIDSMLVMFEKAITLDPQFSLAYAGTARCYNAIFFTFDADPKWQTKSFVAIEKALTLNPKLAEAYIARANFAWTLSNGFPHEKAINELKHAIKLNPNLVEAHESLGSIYFHIGLLDKAMREMRIALRLDPMSRFAQFRVGRIHWYKQELDSALIVYQTLPKPTGWEREEAIVLWSLGRREEAFKVLDQFVISDKEDYDIAASYAVLLAGVGKRKEAEEKIKFAIEYGEGSSHFHHAEHLIASAYALLGDSEAAVEWLRKAADHGLPCYPLFKNDPNLKNIRNNPGYISLMEKLEKQWEHYTKKL